MKLVEISFTEMIFLMQGRESCSALQASRVLMEGALQNKALRGCARLCFFVARGRLELPTS